MSVPEIEYLIWQFVIIIKYPWKNRQANKWYRHPSVHRIRQRSARANGSACFYEEFWPRASEINWNVNIQSPHRVNCPKMMEDGFQPLLISTTSIFPSSRNEQYSNISHFHSSLFFPILIHTHILKKIPFLRRPY